MGRGRLGRLVLVRAMVNEGARVHWDFMSIDGTKVHTADIIYTPLYSNNYPWVQLRHELIANHGVINHTAAEVFDMAYQTWERDRPKWETDLLRDTVLNFDNLH